MKDNKMINLLKDYDEKELQIIEKNSSKNTKDYEFSKQINFSQRKKSLINKRTFERIAACVAVGFIFILSGTAVSAAVNTNINFLPAWFKDDDTNSDFVSLIEEQGFDDEVQLGKYIEVQDNSGKIYYLKRNYVHEDNQGTFEGIYLMNSNDVSEILKKHPEALAKEVPFDYETYDFDLISHQFSISFADQTFTNPIEGIVTLDNGETTVVQGKISWMNKEYILVGILNGEATELHFYDFEQ